MVIGRTESARALYFSGLSPISKRLGGKRYPEGMTGWKPACLMKLILASAFLKMVSRSASVYFLESSDLGTISLSAMALLMLSESSCM